MTGVLDLIHTTKPPAELAEKLAEVTGLVDLKELQSVMRRIQEEIGADKVNPDRFSTTNPPLHADGSVPTSNMSALRLVGENRSITEAEHKAAQLAADLQAAYSKMLSAIEDLASVQSDTYYSSC